MRLFLIHTMQIHDVKAALTVSSSLHESLTRAFTAFGKGTGTPLRESVFLYFYSSANTFFFVRDTSSIQAEDKSCDSTPLMQTYFQFSQQMSAKTTKKKKGSASSPGDCWETFAVIDLHLGTHGLSVSDLTTRGGNVRGSLFKL